ncbi:hypothetical protein CTA2_11965 [Colletotrichum tanaceti]|uniref:Biogenesis of lysosome-related organelles complex 1 subunit 1 n=1 Tax=Colletotrichum tanaceti TaxID=1306861 RepID=A0A4U6XM25_9PEZI|nr:hypothetical protein CTA2_11965 [Colletotrichum tanaceti]TKW56719.1 hypothetical protein CTA1_1539 [Colletotrichum tanaceti]
MTISPATLTKPHGPCQLTACIQTSLYPSTHRSPPSRPPRVLKAATSIMFAAQSLSSSAGRILPPAPPSTMTTTTTSSSSASASASQHLSVSSAARGQHSQSSNTSISGPLPPQQQLVHNIAQHASTALAPSASPPPLLQTLPGADQERNISEARAAVVASIGNMLDGELQTRARMLHSNAAALDKQERDVVRATDALRKENDKLARFAGDAARRVKELGNVQNWAEVLERDFLVLEETFRLVREGGCGSECESWSGSASWSGSEAGDGEGDVRMGNDDSKGLKKGKMKMVQDGVDAGSMEVDGAHEDCSESQSLTEAESVNGTEGGRTKESETMSNSTL